MTSLPLGTGVGFKAFHLRDALADAAPPAFIEVHAENYFCAGGPPHRQLEAVAARMPLSIHGVGLSLGGAERPDRAHLDALCRLLQRYRPASFSEHLAWSSHAGEFQADLLPPLRTSAHLQRVCEHVDEAQQALGRAILLENPSSYVELAANTLGEAEFLAALHARTRCGLLLDVNNLYVSSRNLRFDPRAWLDVFPLDAVGEIHLAGHASDPRTGLLIDDHGSPVADAVWRLYSDVIARGGPRPTMVEWDTDPPDWRTMKHEAALADRVLGAGAPEVRRA
jgi:uncharacterized protein (UPF0276 family)